MRDLLWAAVGSVTAGYVGDKKLRKMNVENNLLKFKKYLKHVGWIFINISSYRPQCPFCLTIVCKGYIRLISRSNLTYCAQRELFHFPGFNTLKQMKERKQLAVG